ncbi:ferritin-like domain-containing protein [Parasphingorhabdus sp. DH2-15]|uniref:ferritin-like domain-containing protein n=1 Tax=Parasphingorhabdus sp. DH2-15 TaxID=3444112 RepID=UPI003F687BC6
MISDPITQFTTAELKLIEQMNAQLTHDTALAKLKELLQVAVEIELATIPIYLYTYYSIDRTRFSGAHMRETDIFANKAGGAVMSVAVEEMLHMSLSSNILYSLGQMPQLYLRAPQSYPAPLPFHNPQGPKGPNGGTDVRIPLAKLTYEQLWHFLQIEYPEAPDATPQDSDWDSIGQVYSYIRCLIACAHLTDADFTQGPQPHQIQGFNYSPNNTDTVHPSGKFDPWKAAPNPAIPNPPPGSDPLPSASDAAVYSNAADSHAGPAELITIGSKQDAYFAIDTVCDQGEGYSQPGLPTQEYDDQSKSELSHYYKFLTIQAQFDRFEHYVEQLPANPAPPAPVTPTMTEAGLAADKVVFDYPDNPMTADYPTEFQPISNFCNGVFQYMLVLTETLFLVPPEEQKLFFNEGMHRSMIWVLDKYIQGMRKVSIPSGKFAGKSFACTFENLDLGTREASFATLRDLGTEAIAAANALAAADKTKYGSLASNVTYYVDQTFGVTDGTTKFMPLPDVKDFWNGDTPVSNG